MTERLYYRDATLRTFQAHVADLADGGLKVYLDRTAFYPTSGGQPHDIGTLGGVAVIDVVDEGDRVAHVLDAPLNLPSAAELRGEIDWARRHDHMQQHTGQHLLSAVLEDDLGLRTLSVHFGDDSSTLDVADANGGASVLEPGVLARIEMRTNEVVAEARPVTVTFEDAVAATATGLRKASDRDGILRIVTIDRLDRSACGGTHVDNTAAIGAVLLRRQEKVRQGLRIEFLCGQRAIGRARRDLEALSRIARVYSSSIDDAPRLVEGQAAQLAELQSEIKKQGESLARYRAAELHAGAAPDARGLRIVVERLTSGVDTSRPLALAYASLPHAMLVAASSSPPSVLVATSADSGIDAGKTLRPLLEQVGGRGGGSPRLAQGSAPSVDAVERVIAQLTSATTAG